MDHASLYPPHKPYLVGCSFPFILWKLWLARNRVLFHNDTWLESSILSTAYKKAIEFTTVNTSTTYPVNRVECFIRWDCPPLHYIKLNVDGASNRDGFAGMGGVFRDPRGNLFIGFSQHLFKNGNNMVELWAVKKGLQLAHMLQLQNLIIESDSQYIISLRKGEITAPWYFVNILLEVQHLVCTCNFVVFVHKYHGGNGVADVLA